MSTKPSESILRHKLACMEPGGGLHEMGEKVDKIVDEMSAARGSARVWKLVGTAAWAVAIILFGWALTHYSSKHSDENHQRQMQAADKVTEKLQKVEEATKAFLPVEAFSTKK